MKLDMSKERFRNQLRDLLIDAERARKPYLEVVSADLHREVGGYPPAKGESHRMPVCCDVMRDLMSAGDMVIAEPSFGKGATLKIRYKLPRSKGR